MAESNLFEEMLATYPAERRELAREVCHRFADGNSTEFFTQLLLVLDVYAHYVEHIPRRMIAANADSLATMQEVQGEIAHMAEIIKARDVNLTNQVEKINGLCQTTQTKCDQASAGIETAVKNITTQVDTKSIVAGIQAELKISINEGILQPFIRNTERLAVAVSVTLADIQAAAKEAKTLWAKRIWRTAWTTSVVWSLFAALIVACLFCWNFRASYEHKMAVQIANASQVLKLNRETFQQLAVAQVPVKLAPVQNDDGRVNPQGFVLVIEGAYAADMRQVNGQNVGCIFFNSSVPEKLLRHLQQDLEKSVSATNTAAK